MPHRLFGILLLGLVAACSAESPTESPVQPAAAPAFEAGSDYFVIEPALPTRSGDRIEVVEVFGYSCIHCAHLQPVVGEWKQQLPADVHFEYMPAVFGGVWEIYARVFYTAQTMGLHERTHDELFKANHEQKRFNSLEDIAGFFAEHGADKDQFMSTMDSFPVQAKIAEAQRIVPLYGVEATPTLIVEGKYRVTVPSDGGFKRMLEVVDFLIAKERAQRSVG